MNRADALHALSSDAPAERLEAARILQFWALPVDVPDLRAAIARESVGWVRRALESALARLGDQRSVTVDLEDLRKDDRAISDDLAAVARARVARTVVHELEPIVGLIEYYAVREFDGYQGSRTMSHVERLAAMLRAIEVLGTISNTPRLESVDVMRLLIEVVEAEQAAANVNIRLEGPTQMHLNTDPNLLRLIVSNGLRNSCESVQQILDRPTSVTVFYGATDRDAWIAIVDNGVGLPSGSSKQLFEMGTSTKENHLGMGLTLCYEAARALGGNLQLSTESTYTRLDFMLPIPNGND